MESFLSISIIYHNQYGNHVVKWGWSKYGDRTYGVEKEESDEWYCQVCGEKQIKILPSYLFPTDCNNRDFIKVCSECKAKANRKKIVLAIDLLHIIGRG